MAKRTPAEVFADLLGVGFTRDQAQTLTAVAGGESGWDDTELGDVGLEDSYWGPSFGIFQIRTVKSQTGTGGDRDIRWLAASDANQAKAAYDISAHGTNFTPWSVYTSGKWQSFLGPASAAAASISAGGALTVKPAQFGPSWAPWNWGSGAAQALGGARSIVLEGLCVVLGLGLIGAGIAQTLAPGVKRQAARAAKAAEVAVAL